MPFCMRTQLIREVVATELVALRRLAKAQRNRKRRQGAGNVTMPLNKPGPAGGIGTAEPARLAAARPPIQGA